MINRKLSFLILPVIFLILPVILMPHASANEISGVKVKALNSRTVDTKTFVDGQRPILIAFFAICCNPSLNALEDIHEHAEELIDKYDLKIILISVDDSRNSGKVAPLLKSKGYNYDIYHDENGDFKRVMGVIDSPHFMLFDSSGNSIYTRNGYMPGIMEEVKNALE